MSANLLPAAKERFNGPLSVNEFRSPGIVGLGKVCGGAIDNVDFVVPPCRVTDAFVGQTIN